MRPHIVFLRQVELSLSVHDSSCLIGILICSSNSMIVWLNSTLKGLTHFVNPQNTEFTRQYGI